MILANGPIFGKSLLGHACQVETERPGNSVKTVTNTPLPLSSWSKKPKKDCELENTKSPKTTLDHGYHFGQWGSKWLVGLRALTSLESHSRVAIRSKSLGGKSKQFEPWFASNWQFSNGSFLVLRHWLYGDKVNSEERVRGWFPRKCAVEVMDNGRIRESRKIRWNTHTHTKWAFSFHDLCAWNFFNHLIHFVPATFKINLGFFLMLLTISNYLFIYTAEVV